MLSVLSAIVAPLVICAASGPLEAGQHIHFRGTVAQRLMDAGQPAAQQKSFDLSWFVADVDAAGATLFWLVEERGRGTWLWPERFGSLKTRPARAPAGGARAVIAVRLRRRESVVPLPAPVVSLDKPLSVGLTWMPGGEEFEVQQERDLEGRATWQIQVRNAYGLKRTMLVDKATPLLAATTDRVFMNKGTEYTLEMKLAGIDKQTVEEAAATRTAFDGLLALVAKLHRPRQSTDTDWTPEQLALLAAAAPELEKQAAGGPLAPLPLPPGAMQNCKVVVPTRSRR